MNRLRSEGREQGREHGEVLQRPQRDDVELGDAAHERKHPVALGNPETPEDVGELVGLLLQRGVGEVPDGAALADPAKRQVVGERPGGMAVDRLMRDIEAPLPRAAPRASGGPNPT